MSTPNPCLPLENRILLQALRLDDGSAAALRRMLSEPLDWARLRDLALTHGVQPLIYARLRDVAPDLVPHAEMRAQRGQFVYNGQRNLRLTGRLLKLLSALSEREISALALKGPALAIQAYGDLALRDFADLDLLVPREALARTFDILDEQGYAATPPLGSAAANDKLKADSELHFRAGDVHIDVHWRPIERFLPLAVDLERWRTNSITIDLLGRPVPTLAPEDALLYLSINGLRDGWCSLKTIVDLAHLCQAAPDAAHAQLWDQAERIGARRIVALGLSLASHVVGVDLPPVSLRYLESDEAVTILVNEAASRLTLELVDGATAYALFRRARERLRDRIACRLTPGPRDWAVVELPASLDPLYYLIRPLRLGGSLLRRSWRTAGRLVHGRLSTHHS